MARRWMAMLAAALALATHGCVNAEADCLPNDAPCAISDGCPAVCCSGAPPRMTGEGVRFCSSTAAMLAVDSMSTNVSPDPGSMTSDTAPASSSGADPLSDLDPLATAAPSTEGSNNQDPTYSSSSQAAPTEAPASFPAMDTDNVNALDSETGISGSRGGQGGFTTIIAVVGVVAGCMILVAAVVYKRKNPNKHPLEIPGSSYQGTSGSGLTPDNRSLDGMLGRGTNDSMKQLPVLSMASRQDASIVRLSSPFGNGSVRISSPAHRGGSNEDFAFAVDTSSRAGSHVNVNYVDTDMEIVVQKNGVVAL